MDFLLLWGPSRRWRSDLWVYTEGDCRERRLGRRERLYLYLSREGSLPLDLPLRASPLSRSGSRRSESSRRFGDTLPRRVGLLAGVACRALLRPGVRRDRSRRDGDLGIRRSELLTDWACGRHALPQPELISSRLRAYSRHFARRLHQRRKNMAKCTSIL